MSGRERSTFRVRRFTESRNRLIQPLSQRSPSRSRSWTLVTQHPAGPKLRALLGVRAREPRRASRRCFICETVKCNRWARATDLAVGAFRCNSCNMYRIRHSVDKPQKQGNARWYRFSLVELYRMCHAWGVNVRWQGASKDDLIGRLDEAMERATVAELRNKCECLGIHRYQRDETRQGLLRRVQAAQWAQCEECEKCEETLTAGDDDALFVGAHINEIRRAMTSAGYPVKSTMSKVDLLDLLEGTDPATLAIGRSEEEVPSEDKPLSSLKINDVRRMLKQYGVRYGISDNMGSLMKYLEGVGVGEAEQGLGVPSVGQRVRVYWDDEQMWYGGTVKQVLEQYGLGYVEYDDGDEAWEAFGVGSRTTWAYGEGEEGERDEVTGDGDGNVPAAPVDNVESPERASDREVTTEAGAGVVRGELALSPLTALIDSKSLSDVYLDMVPSFGADVVGATSPALRFGQPLSPGDWVAGGDDHHQPPQDERPLPTHGECREIAIRVLRDAAMSMSPAEIVRTAIGRGWITLGNDLASTRIRGRFCSALNNIPRDLVGVLVKPSVGKYGLAEWSAGRDVAEDDSSEPPPQLVPPSSPQSPPRSLSSPAHRSSQGFVNRIRDYGDLPTWSKKAIRGASASLLVNTPTAIENAERADTAEYTEEFAGSDDNDLFGEERKWGMDLPDAHSGWEAPHTESGGQINGLLGNASSALSRSSMCPLDLDISPEEVIQRIDLVCDFLEDCVYDKHLPFIPLPSRDSRPAFNLESDAAIARFSHMMIALDIIHENLVEYSDARITQRDLYYIAHSRDPSIKSTAFMQTIQDLSVLLNVPRFAMGIDCRSKGLVYGPIELPGGVSCMVPRGTPISGSVVDTLAIPRVNLQSVTCIIVAEKESVFQRLAKEAASHPIFSTCLIVTGCGYPDIGTRAFLHRLHMQDTNVPIVGIVDWNPHGAHILCQFRYGSARSLESQAFCVPVAWLGMRSATLEALVRESTDGPDVGCFTDCTSRDLSLAKSLRVKMEEYDNYPWMTEIQCMEYGLKADIEGVYGIIGGGRGLADLLGGLIERREWI